MTELIYILKILYYHAFVLIMYKCASTGSPSFVPDSQSKLLPANKSSDRIYFHLFSIIFLCIIIGYYAIICGQVPYASDRLSFALRFENDTFLEYTKAQSLGLYFLELFLHLFTHDPSALFFFIGAFCLFISLMALNSYEEVYRDALLYLGFSSYIYLSFMLLKQAPAIAFAGWAFAFYFKKKKICFLLCLIAAISFHETSFILIILFLVFRFSNNKYMRWLLYLMLFSGVVLFEPITKVMIRVFVLIPGMQNQISGYLTDEGAMKSFSSVLTIFKGTPYYIIMMVTLIKRKKIGHLIKNYDQYLLLTVFVSVSFLMSGYMYWMWRFGALCFIPVFVFASNISNQLTSNLERLLFKSVLVMSFFLLTTYALYEYYFLYGGF